TLGVGVAWSAHDERDQVAVHSQFRWAREDTRPTLWETRLRLREHTVHFVRRKSPRASRIDAGYFALGSLTDVGAFTQIIGDRLNGPADDGDLRHLISGAVRPNFAANGLLPGEITRYVPAEPVREISLEKEEGSRQREGATYRSISRTWAEYAKQVAAKASGLCDDLSYLGPLRHAPERFVILTGGPRLHVGVTGALATEVLAGNQSLLELVSEWLYRLQLPYSIAVERVGSPATEATVGELLALVLTDVRSG